ncbi:hypothetical protein [Actinomadura rudentiformis]|uniref:Uncharacterized protein n=1 Tax=Actinomadura rudentiformis TaxID=359158 RepID=A0A6H9YUK8_9ACTN|nr:hypothetical protein [Actinomadura rudentiformis]KAB2347346.1 hypothetical protein F8566_20250 [Actinomadura rudentiformis]
MGSTAKGQPSGLATLNSSGKIPASQLSGELGNFAQGAAVADVATANADATYGQPEADLINELKTKMNALLASLRAGNIIDT